MGRFRVFSVLAVIVALVVMACAPAAPPTPTPAPKPAAPAPAAPPTAAPKPAAPAPAPTAAPKPAAPAPAPTAAPKPAAPTAAAKPAATAAAKPSAAGKKLRMGFTSAPDFGAIYTPLVKEKLKGMGVELEWTNFNGQDPAVKALLIGEIDLMEMGLDAVIPLNEQGANLRSLLKLKSNEWTLLTSTALKTPADLNGKRIGIHGPNTLTEQLVNAMIKKHNIKANILVVPGSPARVQALLNNQLDATPSKISEVLEVTLSKPGQYHMLARYSAEFPFLTGSTLLSKKEFIDKEPELVQTAVTAFVQVMNDITQKPEIAKQAAPSYVPKLDPKVMDASLAEYKTIDFWNPNLSRESAQKQVEFMLEHGIIKGKAPALESFLDLRFFEKVKDQFKR